MYSDQWGLQDLYVGHTNQYGDDTVLNTNGARNKIEKSVMICLLQIDIVFLNEVKILIQICLLGYVVCKSLYTENPHRRRTVLMVKDYLSKENIMYKCSKPSMNVVAL